MEENQIYTIILRHDTSSNWALNDPVLALGEYGVEDDTHKVKRGDGVTVWSSLDYETFGIEYLIAFENITGEVSDNEALQAALDEKLSVDIFEDNGNTVVESMTLRSADDKIARLTKVDKNVKYTNTVTSYVDIVSSDNSITGLWSIDSEGVNILNLKAVTSVEDYTPGNTYRQYQICFYNNTLFRSKQALTATEEFDSTLWTALTNNNASSILFDPNSSTITSTDMESAIKEVNEKVDNKVDKTDSPNRVYATDSNGEQTTLIITELGQVNTVNNVEADSNKNIEITASDIPYDSTQTIKEAIDAKGDTTDIVGQLASKIDKDVSDIILTDVTLTSDSDGPALHFVKTTTNKSETTDVYFHIESEGNLIKLTSVADDIIIDSTAVDEMLEEFQSIYEQQQANISNEINSISDTKLDKTFAETLENKIVGNMSLGLDSAGISIDTTYINPTNSETSTNRIFLVSSKGQILSTVTSNKVDLEVDSEQLDFDSQESGLVSTTLPTAIRELKTTMDDSLSNMESTVSNMESVVNTIQEVGTQMQESFNNKLDKTFASELDNKLIGSMETGLDDSGVYIQTKAVNTTDNSITTDTVHIVSSKGQLLATEVDNSIDLSIDSSKLEFTPNSDSSLTSETITDAIHEIETKAKSAVNKKLDKTFASEINNKVAGKTEYGLDSNGVTITTTFVDPTTGETSTGVAYITSGHGQLTASVEDNVIDMGVYSENLSFDPQDSGLTSTTIPGAIRELKSQQGSSGSSVDLTEVQEALATKVDKVDTPSVVYGVSSTGEQVTYDISLFGVTDVTNVNVATVNGVSVQEGTTNILIDGTQINVDESAETKTTIKESLDTKLDNSFASGFDNTVIGDIVCSAAQARNGIYVKIDTLNVLTKDVSSQGIYVYSDDEHIVFTEKDNGMSLSVDSDKLVFNPQESGLTSVTIPTAIIELKTLIDNIPEATEVVQVVEQVTNITNNITTIEESITNITQDITEVTENITTVENKVTTIEENVTNLTESITTVEGSVTTINENITTIEGNITTVENTLATVESNVATIESNISTLEDSLTTVQTTIADLETDKLDKVSTESIVYGTDESGNQIVYNAKEVLNSEIKDEVFYITIPIRTLQDTIYDQDTILGWFGVTSVSDLKAKISGDYLPILKYGITLSTNPYYYKMVVEYMAFESANQLKMVFTGLNTSNDEVSKYEIVINLDGTVIEGNSNIKLTVTEIEGSSSSESGSEPESGSSSGSVAVTVNGQTTDENGNITLDATLINVDETEVEKITIKQALTTLEDTQDTLSQSQQTLTEKVTQLESQISSITDDTKLDKVTTESVVYGTNESGEQTTYSLSSILNSSIDSEQLVFDPQTSELVSITIPSAIRELKTLVDTNTTAVEQVQSTIEQEVKDAVEEIVDTSLVEQSIQNVIESTVQNIAEDVVNNVVDEVMDTKATIVSYTQGTTYTVGQFTYITRTDNITLMGLVVKEFTSDSTEGNSTIQSFVTDVENSNLSLVGIPIDWDGDLTGESETE